VRLSVGDRARTLQAMSEDEFDIAIIGGGITGAGVARDAASRGLKVALIEGGDFASGTSSRSSKLIHGGIRYLENLEFHLVFEALSERQRLFEMAPHLVHPLRFLLPVYKSGRVPAWKIGMGMWLYDALSLFEAPELSQFLDRQEVHDEFPALQLDSLSGAFAYYDAYMDDDRLVIETLRSAKEYGAEIVNYVRATGAEFEGDFVGAIECEDQISKEKFSLRARHFVSSVGPWTDLLGAQLFESWKKMLRPSKGVHLTFDKKRFQLHDAVVMGAENRIVFAIPRHEMVIVGTTDTDFEGDPALVQTTAQDVDYLLRVIDRYFPGAAIKRSDIIGCYAGVRPLIDDGAQSESKTSREHLIWTDPRGVTFVAGGKYTTYRNMAEQTVDEVLRHFSLEERVRYNRPQTLLPLNPLITEDLFQRALREHPQWAKESKLSTTTTGALAERHGLEAQAIIQQALPVLPRCATEEEWLWCAESLHAIEHTMCLSLTDFFLRRTHLILARADHGLPFANAIAQVMGDRLGWDQSRRLKEINALQNQLKWELAATT
jgi:glycerol-3-phosphate dehydrogenase